MSFVRKIFLLFFVCHSIFSAAQVIPFISEKSLSPSEKYSIQVWTTENGLPQNSINDITQTNDGYLWMGTFDGLVRFDGIKFTVYNTSNTPELKANGIKRLFTDSKDRLWIIAADGSLVSYFKNKFQSHAIPSKVIFYKVAVTNWMDHSVLVACENNKVYRIRNDEVSEFSIPDYIEQIHTMLSKFDDQLYIGAENGLFSFINNEWHAFSDFKGKKSTALYRSPTNDIIADIENELYVVHPKNTEHYTIPLSLTSMKTYTLGFNEQKQLTVLSDQGLFIILENNKVNTITTQNGLSSNGIGSVFVDKQNNFWVGTSNGGINKLKTKIFHTFSKEEGMNDDGATAVIETSDNGILIANNCTGVSQYRERKFTGEYQFLKGTCIWSIHEDHEKNQWFGAYGGGIFLKDKKGNVKKYGLAEGLPSDVVFSIYSDSKKQMWAGTSKGLAYFSSNRFIAFDTAFKNTITFIFEDRNKQLFLCTDKGLAIISNEKIIFLENGDLKRASTRYVYEDTDGSLWIGTHGNGLIRFKNGKTFSFAATPLDNNVWSITEDAGGNFWLPSNSGMYVIARKELNDYAEGIIKTLNPVYLSKEDGLKSIEFNGGFQPTVLKSRSGEFWFPTVKGVAVADPADLKKSDYSPRIVIEKVFSDDAAIELRDTLSLKSSSSLMLISFTAPSFINPAKLNFQYKIEGVNNTWIDIGSAREIKLNNIPFGTYILRIRPSGSTNNKETSIIINKPLPFWKETRFITVAIFIFVLIMLITSIGIIGYIRKRERKKTLLNKQYANIELKALQAQMNPHFIFNCLNSIQHFIVVNDEISASRYLTKFSMLMRLFLEHSKSNVITLQEEIDLLRLYIDLESLRFKKKFSFQIDVDPETDTFNVEIPSMLFQPFVENAINHGLVHLDKGTLNISFIVRESILTGIVEDDGIGRKKAEELRSETHKEHTSRGMEIIKERIAVLNKMENTNILLEVIDKTDANGKASGTKVIIQIPI